MEFSIRSVLKDIEDGLTDEEIKAKHGMSDSDLAQLYAAKSKADEFINKIIGHARRGEFFNPRTEHLAAIYELAQVGAEERKRIDLERYNLRKALEKHKITLEEFQQRIRLLIPNLLERMQ